VHVDKRVVAGDIRQKRRNIPDSAHVGREVVDLVDVPRGLQAVIPPAQIQNLKLIGCGLLVLRVLDIHTTNPGSIALEPAHEMMPDETACAGDKNALVVSHTKCSFGD